MDAVLAEGSSSPQSGLPGTVDSSNLSHSFDCRFNMFVAANCESITAIGSTG
jgi:hypothetical protein